MLQNPLHGLDARRLRLLSASYAPDMDWSRDLGRFRFRPSLHRSHRALGHALPGKAVPEWTFVPDYDKLLAGSPSIDVAEASALADCVRAFLLYYPGRSVASIPWCENDYQIDVGTPEGVEEYKRIMDRASELGVTHLSLHAGQQLALPPRRQRRLLGLGERPLVRARPEAPERGVGPAPRRRTGRAQGDARLCRLEEPQAHGLRLSVAALPPESRVDRLGRGRRREIWRRHGPALLPGLVAGQAPVLHEDDGRGRIFF